MIFCLWITYISFRGFAGFRVILREYETMEANKKWNIQVGPKKYYTTF